MFLQPTSVLTRLSAIFIGLIWAGIGGFWSWQVLALDSDFPTRETRHVCLLVLFAGVMLVISALRPAKPRDFESETPDLHMEMSGDGIDVESLECFDDAASSQE